MDSLSTLVKSMGLQGSVDLLCRFAGSWVLEHEAHTDGQVPWHMILGGHGVLEVGHSRTQLESGDLVLFPRGAAHILRNASDSAPVAYAETRSPHGLVTQVDRTGGESDFDVLCGMFELGQQRSLLLQALPDVVHIPTRGRDDCVWLDAVMRMMRHESVQAQPGGGAVIEELSRALFTVVIRTLMARGTMKHGLLGLLTEPRLSLAIAAVIAAPAQPWTVESLARQSNMSRASFARRFAEVSEMTPLDAVTALRMDLAGRLLRESQRPTELIAEECGYASRPAFGRAFKRFHGVTPAAYRRQLSGGGASIG